MSKPSQSGQRMAFMNSMNAIKRAGLNPAKAVLSQSYLRLETLLVANQSTYNFDVLVNENNQSITINTQQKLNLQDAFVCSNIGFYLAVPTSSTDTTFRPLTYPAIGSGLFTATNQAAAYALYNGYWQLTINQRTVITAWDLNRHLFIPETQLNAYTTVKSAASVAFVDPEHANNDAYDGSSDGQFPVEPNIVFSGSNKHQFQIALPVGIASVPANSRIVCIMRGILAQNVTVVNG